MSNTLTVRVPGREKEAWQRVANLGLIADFAVYRWHGREPIPLLLPG